MNNPALQSDDVYLLAQIEKGDRKSFELLFDKYSPGIMKLAGEILHSRVLAQDVVQDVFVQVWSRKEKLSEIENFRGWLFIVSRNRCFKLLNEIAKVGVESAEAMNHLPDHGAEADHNYRTKYIQEAIHKAMQDLPEQQRRVFEMARMQGMSRTEIAEAMGLSPNTVKVHLGQAVKTLRAKLSDHMPALIALMVLNKFF